MSDTPDRPTADQLARYATLFNQSRSLKFFGAEVSFPDADTVRVTLAEVLPEHRGGLGTTAVNGMVLAGLFDLAIGCTPALVDPTRRTATVQLSMSFEHPVIGDSLAISAKINRSGASVLFASAVLNDQEGQACARCQGIVRLSKRPWDTGGSPAVN